MTAMATRLWRAWSFGLSSATGQRAFRVRVARLVAPRHRKEFSADVSRCTQNTQMLRWGL
jgi:hypothetical protein